MLEGWSDIRAFDGTASIIQPLIRPLYDTRTAHQMLALLNDAGGLPLTIWCAANGKAPTHPAISTTGGSSHCRMASSPIPPRRRFRRRRRNCRISPPAKTTASRLTLSPDPSVFDGSVGNNAWLQECPKPFTKQVWGNALHLAEPDARSSRLVDGDVLRITSATSFSKRRYWCGEGQAARTIATTLGYGRSAAGTMGTGVGFDVYRATPGAFALGGRECHGRAYRAQCKISCSRSISSSWKAKPKTCSRGSRSPI